MSVFLCVCEVKQVLGGIGLRKYVEKKRLSNFNVFLTSWLLMQYVCPCIFNKSLLDWFSENSHTLSSCFFLLFFSLIVISIVFTYR